MKRVASLYLPSWSIDRLRRIERRHAPSAEADSREAFDALGADAAAERAQHCSVPNEAGWRPGARWARSDATSSQRSGVADSREQVEAAIKAMPAHRRPPQRELGRTSQPADHPFRKALVRPPEERVAPPALLRELSRRTEGAEPLFRPGSRGWNGGDLQAAVGRLPLHQRPSAQELSRKSEVLDNPFRLSPDDVGPSLRHGRCDTPPLRFPGEDAPAKAERGAALRGQHPQGRHNNAASAASPVTGPGEDGVARRDVRAARLPKRSARDGHGGEAGYVATPSIAQSLKQLAALPAVQFPGEGPHPDNHGRAEPSAPTYGQGRFFQTGRTLSSAVARVCVDDEEAPTPVEPVGTEPPLVTTRKKGARIELAAVNASARALGLSPGMALTVARAQAPGLQVRDADPDGDVADLHVLAVLLARRWAPTVSISDPDGLVIDLTGVAHLRGGEIGFARDLVRLLGRHGIAARIAIADTVGAAWAAARFGTQSVQRIAPEAQSDELAAFPVQALRLEESALELLARLGIDTVGQLMAMPRAPLVRRFGTAIADRLDQATGRAPEPLKPVLLPAQVAIEQRFAEPIATADAIEHWLHELIPKLCVELARAGQGARAVELVAVRVDGIPQRLRLGFARPTRDPAHMLRLTLRRIEEIDPGYGIDAIGLRVRRADPLGPEPMAAALPDDGRPDLAQLIDTLANRIGANRLWRVAPVESDVPERSCAPAPALSQGRPTRHRAPMDDVRHLDAGVPDHPWHPRWPRPVRLLSRPEQVDHVLAELPDQPPRRFTWRGQSHRVVRAEGPERIAGEWWRRTAERHAVRDYFRVEDDQGQRFWLYRRGDGVRGETGSLDWFLHGLGD